MKDCAYSALCPEKDTKASRIIAVCTQLKCCDSSVGRGLHQYCRGQGFKAHSGLNFLTATQLACVYNCDDHSTFIRIFLALFHPALFPIPWYISFQPYFSFHWNENCVFRRRFSIEFILRLSFGGRKSFISGIRTTWPFHKSNFNFSSIGIWVKRIVTV